MGGKLLPFLPRDQYVKKQVEDFATWQTESAKEPELTTLELYKILYEQSLEAVDILVRLYKKTGRWNPVVEKLMGRIVQDFGATCASLAGTDPTQTQSINVRIATGEEYGPQTTV